MPLTSRSGLRKTLITSLKPSTTMAASAHRGGILLLAALFASCVALAYRGTSALSGDQQAAAAPQTAYNV